MKTASEKVKVLLATMNLNGLGGWQILKAEDEILSIVEGLERNKQTYEEHLIERIAERDRLKKALELVKEAYAELHRAYTDLREAARNVFRQKDQTWERLMEEINKMELLLRDALATPQEGK